jgi:hypothetical protein
MLGTWIAETNDDFEIGARHGAHRPTFVRGSMPKIERQRMPPQRKN